MSILKNLKLGTKLGLGFGIVLTLVTAVSAIAYVSVGSLIQISGWVDHTHKVIRVGESVSASMVDMETGLRGFLVTGDEDYLAPYYSGSKNFNKLIKEGAELTSDNPTQVARWKKVDNLESEWLSQWAEPEIAKRKLIADGANTVAAFKEISKRPLGKKLFDGIRDKLAFLDGKIPARAVKSKHLVTKITLALVNMETGQRGYLLSGVDASLEPYIQGKKDLVGMLVELEQSYPKLARETQAVTNAVNEWQDKVAELEIEARREMNKHKYSIDNLIADMSKGTGKKFMDQIRSKIHDIVAAEEGLIVSRVEHQHETANVVTNVTLWGTLIVVVLSMFIAWLVTRSIVSPMTRLRNVVNEVATTGELSNRVDYQSKDEVGETILAFNQLLSYMKTAISEVNVVVEDVTSGKFDSRITSEFNGDLNILKKGVNHSAESVDAFISAISKVMLNMEQGDFQSRVDVEARGDLLVLKDSVNRSMDSLDSAMHDITQILVAQSKGDLTQTITSEFNGELKVLKEAVNTTADKLVHVVSSAMSSSSIVNDAANEVYRGAVSLSQRVQDQAAALEETSATMDEMNSAVQANTENAKEASKVAEDVQVKANEGVEVMQQTIGAMNSIQESSFKISDIVALIDGIAFQTNLLALNAAVEAARAGEHGRGFAVVAGEVRSLAQKSAEAAKDIKGLIDESVSRIDNGTELASKSGEMLETISTSVENVTCMVSQIAQASAEQSDGIGQVHQGITAIDQATQENASLVEETTTASESMTAQASELIENMGFFNTGNSQINLSSPKKESKKSKKSEEKLGNQEKLENQQEKPKRHKSKLGDPKSKNQKVISASSTPPVLTAKKPGEALAKEEEWGQF